MMTKEYNYYYNPYLPEDREGKGEMMSFIRAMLLLCITILLSVGALIFSNYTKDRFEIVALKDGVFIFDHQSTASNFCNQNKCIVLSSEFLIPKKVLVAEIPGVVTKTQIQVQNPAVQVQNPVVQGNQVVSQSPQNLVNPALTQPMYIQNNDNNQGMSDQSQQNDMNNDNGQNDQNNDQGNDNDQNGNNDENQN